MEDDGFGDAGWEDGDNGSAQHGHAAELEREWQARREEFYNSGYREGLEAGKHETVQEGFDLGYALGSKSGYEWGVLRGATLTLQAASTRGLVPPTEVAAALRPILELKPGEVQRQICSDLMLRKIDSAAGDETPKDGEESKKGHMVAVEAVKEKAVAAINELGFSLEPHRAS